MMKKYGVNNTRAEKSGPTVKNAISHRKMVVCGGCKKRFEKECPSEEICDISAVCCPYCGASIK